MPQNADTLEKDLLENDWDSFCDSSQFHSLIINDKHVSISGFCLLLFLSARHVQHAMSALRSVRAESQSCLYIFPSI